ncbi:MAG: SOS response-associated peptidase [Myxococcaceae bacterium]
MCGRFTDRLDASQLVEVFGLEGADAEIPARFNVAPRAQVPIIASDRPRRLSVARWGLVPARAKDARLGDRLVNARLEDLARRPTFQSGETRRCVVLADGFYEWQRQDGRKVPWFFEFADHRPFGFAGLWDQWSGPEGKVLRTCVILTTAAAGAPAAVHDRMPVVLPLELYPRWLSGERIPLSRWAAVLGGVHPPWVGRQVSSYVNSTDHEGQGCLAASSPA